MQKKKIAAKIEHFAILLYRAFSSQGHEYSLKWQRLYSALSKIKYTAHTFISQTETLYSRYRVLIGFLVSHCTPMHLFKIANRRPYHPTLHTCMPFTLRMKIILQNLIERNTQIGYIDVLKNRYQCQNVLSGLNGSGHITTVLISLRKRALYKDI